MGFCNFLSTIIAVKCTTDDFKVSLTTIWVVFDEIILEKAVWSFILSDI